jgi:hypothetical protein
MLVLDHTDPAIKQQQQQQQQAGASAAADGCSPAAAAVAAAAAAGTAAADVNPAGKSNMRWLIKSEAAEGAGQQGKPKRKSKMPDIVAEAIAHATEDVPEVKQVGTKLYGHMLHVHVAHLVLGTWYLVDCLTKVAYLLQCMLAQREWMPTWSLETRGPACMKILYMSTGWFAAKRCVCVPCCLITGSLDRVQGVLGDCCRR